MKKVLSASVLSLVLFGSVSLSGIEKGFEVRDVLEDRITNEATGRRVTPRRAGEEVTPDVSDDIKVQARYDSETGTYDFRFVAGINTVDVDKASVTVTMGGKQASVNVNKAYERIQNGNATQTAAEVFGEGYNYLVAYALTDVPSSQVGASFNVKVGLVASETEVASFAEDVTLSDVVNADVNELAIQFDNTDPLQVVAGSEVTLPNYTITDGALTGAEVRITAENGIVANGTYTPDRYSDKGTHTLTYTAVQPHTGLEKVLGTLNVEVAPKILTGASVDRVVVSNELSNPVITNTDTGCSGLSFNFEASKYYYAEFDMAALGSYNKDAVIGFSHNILDVGLADSGVGSYYNGFKMNADGYELAHSKYQTGWSLEAVRLWKGSSYANRKNIQKPDIISSTTKVAVARSGDKFYTFFNDGVYDISVYPELQNRDTYPGILFEGDVTNAKFSNFNFIRNVEDVTAKISSLVGITTFDHFSMWGDDTWGNTLTNDYLDFDVQNGVRFSNRGEANDSYNANMASPYVHLYGKWTMEFDYLLEKLSDGSNCNWSQLHIDIRTVQDQKTAFNWMVMSWTDSFGEDPGAAIWTEVGSLSTTKVITEMQKLTHRNTIHFTISCLPNGNSETYTITVSDGTNSFTYNQVVTYGDVTNEKGEVTNYAYLSGGPKSIIFKSKKFVGTISNFTYSTQAA